MRLVSIFLSFVLLLTAALPVAADCAAACDGCPHMGGMGMGRMDMAMHDGHEMPPATDSQASMSDQCAAMAHCAVPLGVSVPSLSVPLDALASHVLPRVAQLRQAHVFPLIDPPIS